MDLVDYIKISMFIPNHENNYQHHILRPPAGCKLN